MVRPRSCLDKLGQTVPWGNDVSLAFQLLSLIVTSLERAMASRQRPYNYADLPVKVSAYVQLALNVLLWCLSWRGSSKAQILKFCQWNCLTCSFLALFALFALDIYWAVEIAAINENFVIQSLLDATGYWAMLNLVIFTDWSGVHVAFILICAMFFCFYWVQIIVFDALSLPHPRYFSIDGLSLTRMACELGVWSRPVTCPSHVLVVCRAMVVCSAAAVHRTCHIPTIARQHKNAFKSGESPFG